MIGSTAAPGDNFGEGLILRERERGERGNLIRCRCRDFALLEVCNRVYDGGRGRRREVKNERGRPSASATVCPRRTVVRKPARACVRAPVFRPEARRSEGAAPQRTET